MESCKNDRSSALTTDLIVASNLPAGVTAACLWDHSSWFPIMPGIYKWQNCLHVNVNAQKRPNNTKQAYNFEECPFKLFSSLHDEDKKKVKIEVFP